MKKDLVVSAIKIEGSLWHLLPHVSFSKEKSSIISILHIIVYDSIFLLKTLRMKKTNLCWIMFFYVENFVKNNVY